MTAGRDAETLRMYWQDQWERNGQLEDQRLQVSNYVTAASVIALGIFAASSPSSRLVWFATIAILVANVAAAAYSVRSEQWARLHKARARLVLRENWAYLADLQVRSDGSRPHGRSSLTRRLSLQLSVHVVIALASIGLAIWH